MFDAGELSDESILADYAVGDNSPGFDKGSILDDRVWANDCVRAEEDVPADPTWGDESSLTGEVCMQSDLNSGTELADANTVGSPGVRHPFEQSLKTLSVAAKERRIGNTGKVIQNCDVTIAKSVSILGFELQTLQTAVFG